jgi:hypothetical protein
MAAVLLAALESGEITVPDLFGENLVADAKARLFDAAQQLAPEWGIAWAQATGDQSLLDGIQQASLELALKAGDIPISPEDMRTVVGEALAGINIDQIILTELLEKVDPDLEIDPGVIKILDPEFVLTDDPSIGPLVTQIANLLDIDAEELSDKVLEQIRSAILQISGITPAEYEEMVTRIATNTANALNTNIVSVLSDADLSDPQAIKDAIIAFVTTAGQSITELDVSVAFAGFDEKAANALALRLGSAIQNQGIGAEIAAFLGTDLASISTETWTGLFDPASVSIADGIANALVGAIPTRITTPAITEFGFSAADLATALGGTDGPYYDVGVSIINAINEGLAATKIFGIQIPGVEFGGVNGVPGTQFNFTTINPVGEPTEAGIQDELATAKTVQSGNAAFNGG